MLPGMIAIPAPLPTILSLSIGIGPVPVIVLGLLLCGLVAVGVPRARNPRRRHLQPPLSPVPSRRRPDRRLAA